MSLTKKLLVKCKSKYTVKFLTTDEDRIVDALEYTFDLKNAKALIACLEPDTYKQSISYVMTVDIAKYIIELVTKLGFAVNYTELMLDTPRYTDYHDIDLALNSYFILQGGNPDVFTEEYLQELYAYNDEIRARLISIYGQNRWV
jgi:hypothetical protein